jgi:predicted membrane channel-forming protein YqfA (hemolysin III family)
MSGLSWKARRRWALVVLLVGMPLYVVVATSVVALFDRPPIWLELLIYVALGIIWVLPFRALFRGVGREDPDAPGSGPKEG